nr:MAG TPA: hypothetical protein [Caudoviricetes sp.]
MFFGHSTVLNERVQLAKSFYIVRFRFPTTVLKF